MAAPRILIVTTSHAQLGNTDHATGVWAEELATPYYALLDGGADLTLASVAGGEVPFDPRSLPASAGSAPGEVPGDAQDAPQSVRRFLADEVAMHAARSTPTVEAVSDRAFDAIYLPGGHGTMWDLPESDALAQLVGRLFDEGRVISAVCHGPAGLVAARRADGRAIVDGRRVTAFTNSEEDAVGLTAVVPFLLEDRLKELGARWAGAADWQPHTVKDGNLITGQNPQSSQAVARELLYALRTVERRARP